MNHRDVAIYVVSHLVNCPEYDCPYTGLQVGSVSAEKTSITSGERLTDNSGQNISYKNFAYSELTGLYWIWKNATENIVGICHYRRFLKSPDEERPLSTEEILSALEDADVLIPASISFSHSVAEQYCRYHQVADMSLLARIMKKRPLVEQLAFHELLASDSLIPCNIMIAPKGIMDAYCSWLFAILDDIEREIDLFHGRDAYQMRVFGFLAERLMNVWLIANGVRCAHFEILTTDDTPSRESSLPNLEGYSLATGIFTLSPEDVSLNVEKYRDDYPDLKEAFGDDAAALLDHYIRHGCNEGRIGLKAVRLQDYVANRPYLRKRYGTDDFAPYYYNMIEEAKRGSLVVSTNRVDGVTRQGILDYAPVYDWTFYTSHYSDVPNDAAASEDALAHFVNVGMKEGRRASKGFDVETYKEAHPRLHRLFGDTLRPYYLHYMLIGSKEHKGVDWRYAV
ncbi:DUF4422 domain-containing protein [Adlercreutzia sp. ZJ138]|uniref:DUF4422 domain-containing protein n=1 Tax=Adlercreutzia sp. ZJ138 TaxID=2709405 RepID=UPI0013EB0C9B|nr:DUF4422 domain-containing protein [Adlercreutzia sp. ZJ138]